MAWTRFLRRRRWDSERAAEIDAYLAAETADNLARGMPPDEARAAAQRKFGNPTQVREEIYRMNTVAVLDTILRDAAYALRGFRRSPGFTAVAVLSLALGIGSTTAIFSLVDTLLLRWLPVDRPAELVQLTTSMGTSFSYPVLEAIRQGQTVFTDVCAYEGTGRGNIGIGGSNETAIVERVGASYFDVLGVRSVIGRASLGDTGAPLAVISYGYWQRRFGGSPDVLGRTLRFRDVVFPVAGVAPPAFTGYGVDTAADLWIPFTAVSSARQLRGPDAHSIAWLRAFARLKPGYNATSAAAALDVLSARIMNDEADLTRARDPEHRISDADLDRRRAQRLALLPGGRGVSAARRLYSSPLLVLMTVTGLTLLIACANIANLLLARGAARRRELSVRLAIGAGRGRLLAQLITESVLLAATGAAAGVAFASWAGRTLVKMVVTESAWGFTFRLDLRVLAFTAAATVFTVLLFGLGPAIRATRSSQAPKRFGHTTALGRALVIAQTALSVVLLLGAFLFVGTLQRLLHQDFGFQPDSMLVAQVVRQPAEDARLLAAHLDLLRRVAAVPGVAAAALSDAPLFGAANWTNPLFPSDGSGRRITANIGIIAPGFVETMRMPLTAGRTFTERDDASSPKVAVINQTLARQLFPGVSPVGRRFSFRPNGGAEIEVAGVIQDFRYSSLRQPAPPFVFIPLLQPKTAPPYSQVAARFTSLSFRFRGDPASISAAVLREIEATGGSANLFRSQTEMIENTVKQERLLARLSGFFAAAGLLLAAIGLYGLMAYTVGRRRSEIGIRAALGARPGMLVAMVLRESVTLVALGVAAGIAAAYTASRLVEKLLFGVTRADPSFAVLAAAALIAVAVLAALGPALRAGRIDPWITLRHE